MATTIQGTIVAAKVTTGDTRSTYPVADQTEIKGGHHVVADITARDAIPAERREDGMTCYVQIEDVCYQLKGGITNNDWANYIPVSEEVTRIIVSPDTLPAFNATNHLGALYFRYVTGA